MDHIVQPGPRNKNNSIGREAGRKKRKKKEKKTQDRLDNNGGKNENSF